MYVVVGKLGATHGVQGWLRLYSYTEPAANVLTYKPWYLEENTGWQQLELEKSREQNKSILIKLKRYDNPEQARLLTGKKIAVQRLQLPSLKKGEFYWSDLEGLTVINVDGTTLGQVAYLLETGSNDVLVIKGTKEHAIPYLPDVIVSVDLINRVIHVNWELI